MADGSIEFSTSLDNSDLEKQLKDAEKKIEQLKKLIEDKTSERNAIAEEIEQVNIKAEAAQALIEKLKARLDELRASDDPMRFAKMQVVTDELSKEVTNYEQLVDKGVQLDEKQAKLDSQIAEYNEKLKVTQDEYAQVAAEAQKTTKSTVDSSKAMDTFNQKLNAVAKKVLLYTVAAKALSAFKGYLEEVTAENDKFAAAMANFVATLKGAVTPIISVVIPILTAAVNIATAMITTLARLVDMIFNTNLVESINQARAAAQAATEAADATDKQTKATNKLAKAKKKAAKELMAFDEINKLGEEQAEDAANADNGLADSLGVTEKPLDWDAFDAGKIDAKLAEIMLIVGAALMAVGAILAFSGINIPLGLTLMAIGALMIYTAYEEQWDKLPQEVKDAINTALVITAVVLIVLGAVLAFSGVNIPLGIGMMLAGAALLYAAAAINWDDLPDDVKETITKIMVTVGTSLLALGAILALSGANVPIGVGLMIAGALALTAAAALNWDELPDKVKEKVMEIATAVSIAFIAIGAILAFSGAGIGLGIGLMLIGAATLAAEAVLYWDKLPNEVKQSVGKVLAVVGAALLVLGIILVASGVGIPIGIGLILAGVASMGVAAAINWDFLKDKAQEIWSSLTSWFKQNVAPIFTAKWWQEKFKSIANGLIGALNSALAAGNSFLNDLMGGFNNIASTFGVQLNWSVPSVQIPYHAQGAVIPPNREFMAVLGDQSNGRNLEAPEDLIRQIVREESGGQVMSVLYELLDAVREGQSIYVDRQVLGSTVRREMASASLMGGR